MVRVNGCRVIRRIGPSHSVEAAQYKPTASSVIHHVLRNLAVVTSLLAHAMNGLLHFVLFRLPTFFNPKFTSVLIIQIITLSIGSNLTKTLQGSLKKSSKRKDRFWSSIPYHRVVPFSRYKQGVILLLLDISHINPISKVLSVN